MIQDERFWHQLRDRAGFTSCVHAAWRRRSSTRLPGVFASILGAGKLLGAIVITVPGVPRLKEWAYAGFFIDLTAAAISRAAVGDSAAAIVAPLGFLALVLASWALRPADRKLAAPAAPARATARAASFVRV